MTVPIPVVPHAKTRYLGATYTILVTDKDLNVVGDPLEHWTSLQASLRWKEPGSGQIVTPAHRYVREQIAPGNRIVLRRTVYGKGETLLSGPIEEVLRERSDDGEQSGVGIMTITFADDMAWLGARVAYPDPALDAAAQTKVSYDYSGDPATAMYNLVRLNAAQGARPERRVPRLVAMAPTPIAGTATVKGVTTYEKLTEVLRRIATAGVGTGFDPDSLGFTVKQVGTEIQFEVKRCADLSGQVMFGFNAGNLQYYAFDLTAPSLTHPIIGTRGVFPTTDADNLAWGRFESYETDSGGTDSNPRQQADEALAEKGQAARLASNASDTPDLRFGVHYGIGDIVSLELQTGAFVQGLVQTVNLQAYPTAGEVVGVTIGSQAARYDSSYVRMIRILDRRVGDLERIA